MKPVSRIALSTLILGALLLCLAPGRASAHPMGNFSINQYSALQVGDGQVVIRYIVDLAEIPAYQELGTIRPDRSTDLTAQERTTYLARKSSELVGGLSLSASGQPVPLQVKGLALSFPPGNGGLPTMRIELNLRGDLPGVQQGKIEYHDNNFPGRVGWKEIVASAAAGYSLDSSSVPSKDQTGGLTKYNPDAASSPLHVLSATLSYVKGASAQGTTTTSGPAQGADLITSVNMWMRQQTDAISTILRQDELAPGAIALALLIAFAVGSAHALSPGHGKTVVAAYLVGSRGTPLHALFLGLTVTVSHTIGAYLAWIVVNYASGFLPSDALYSWLGVVSGLLIAGMGVILFVQRWRGMGRTESGADKAEDPHEHGHSHQHEHEHGHSHGQAHKHDHGDDHHHPHNHDHLHAEAGQPHRHLPFGPAHTHLPVDTQKVTFGNLLALGIAGGIIPCPSAVVVLLVAVGSRHIELGLPLLLAFSLGLAGVLTSIGLLLVYSRTLFRRVRVNGRFFSRLLVRLPIASAFAVSCLGFIIAFGALNSR